MATVWTPQLMSTGSSPRSVTDVCLFLSNRTPLGTQMDAKILQPFFYQRLQSRSMQKPILVRVVKFGLFLETAAILVRIHASGLWCLEMCNELATLAENLSHGCAGDHSDGW